MKSEVFTPLYIQEWYICVNHVVSTRPIYGRHYNWQSAGRVFGRVQLTIQWDGNSQDLLHNLQLPLNGSSFNAVIHRDE